MTFIMQLQKYLELILLLVPCNFIKNNKTNVSVKNTNYDFLKFLPVTSNTTSSSKLDFCAIIRFLRKHQPDSYVFCLYFIAFNFFLITFNLKKY